MMATISPSIISSTLLIILLLHPSTTTFAESATATATDTDTNLYFSKTFLPNYQKMLTSLKIFIYPPPLEQKLLSLPQNNNSSFYLFYNSLLSSDFLTHNPNQATLYFVPFDYLPVRTLTRHLQYIRTAYPYWNRTLGADHFYFSCQGIGSAAIRNVVELKKNAIQISCFPTPARELVPHKDITLPPILINARASVKSVPTRFLGYWRFATVQRSVRLIKELRNDHEFLIESKPSDEGVYINRIKKAKYCLFVYDDVANEVEGLTTALVHGCVPVVITDRPIKDLPLMDVIRWSEIAMFVGSTVGPREFKKVLAGACENGAYERMRKSGVTAAHHFAWNESSPQPYDAFYMVMYQLWLRRHAIRYSNWEIIEPTTQAA